jgi:hypothetical protein
MGYHYKHTLPNQRTSARILLLSTAINTKGEAVFVADSVKSNPLAELFAKEGSLDSDSLKDLRVKALPSGSLVASIINLVRP